MAVISDRYWRDTLGGGSVLGSALVIDGQPHTIIGILAPTFAVPFMDAQILTPLYANPEPQPRAPPLSVQAVAELAPGATVAHVREELASINRQLAQEYPRTHTGWLLGVELAREWQYGSMRAPLLMLLAATAFVLLIACVNIANLTSAQAIARSGELALRLALGATKGDVLRMHLAELLIVCVSGLIPGLLLASAAVPALLAINPTVARTLGAVEIDWRVQLFSVVARPADGHRRVGHSSDPRDARPDVRGDLRQRQPHDRLPERRPTAAHPGLVRGGIVRGVADGRCGRGAGSARSVAAQPRVSISRRVDGADPAARCRI